VSMKGARGLLVSITGGNDLTLYEVDEAATRIREEVDQDANIIVGATFDESLEGIIRVSVVATGIDLGISQSATTDTRLAELAHKLRVPPQRTMRLEPGAERTPVATAAELAAIDDTSIEQQAPLPPAATIEEVTIRPLPPKPSLFVEQVEDRKAPPAPEAKTFIPPQPERVHNRGPRMPRIDELPLPAQAAIRARREQATQGASAERPRMSLLQRLASVGLGRVREEGQDAPAELRAAPRPIARPPERAPSLPQPAPRAQETRAPEPVSEYGRRPAPSRPAPQGLDLHGRAAPLPGHTAMDDDQLEIPAFLRRQAN
jgi:cell division protein FtsZ